MIVLSLSTGIIFVLLAYTLMSLYDMWQVYRTTSKLWIFVLFLATLSVLFLPFSWPLSLHYSSTGHATR